MWTTSEIWPSFKFYDAQMVAGGDWHKHYPGAALPPPLQVLRSVVFVGWFVGVFVSAFVR